MATINSDINVSVYTAAQAVKAQAFARFAILTEDVQSGFDELYRLYGAPADASGDSDLGTTIKAALAIFFSQKRRPSDVAVIKRAADAAQAEKWTIGAGVGDGDQFMIPVAGVTGTYTATETDTESDVAAALRTDLTTKLAGQALTAGGTGADVTVTSNTAGEPFTAAAGIYEPSGGTSSITWTTTQVNVSLKTELDALMQGNWKAFFGLVQTSRNATQCKRLAEWGLANQRLVGVQCSEADVKNGVDDNVFDVQKSTNNGWAFGIWHDDDAEFFDVAMMAHGLAANPDETHGVWYDLILQGVAQTELDETEWANVESYNGNSLVDLKGVTCTANGKLFSGEWIDDLVCEVWYEARVSEALAQKKLDLANAGQSWPYTNVGLAMIAEPMRTYYKKGVEPNEPVWFRANSLVITKPDISEVLDADIAARHSSDVKATVTRSGGIKTISVSVGLLNS